MELSTADKKTISKRAEKLRHDLIATFFSAFEKANANFGPEKIQQQIVSELTAERRMLTLKMLGFTGSSTGLITASRASAINAFLLQHVEPAVKRWVDECLRPMIEERGRSKLHNAAVMEALIKEYDDRFMYQASHAIRSLADTAGEKFAASLTKQFEASMKLAQE